MATVTHHIYSHYEPPAKRVVDESLHEESEDINRLWDKERLDSHNRLRAPPRFVPASTSFISSWEAPTVESKHENKAEVDVGGWYRCLNRKNAIGPPASDASTPTSLPPIASPPSPSPTTNTTISITSTPASAVFPPIGSSYTTRKKDWFISSALATEAPPLRVPAESLAQMLAREPPPKSTEERFRPPVFLAIGPENIGYGMLQQSGWSEGEVLGSSRRRRKVPTSGRRKQPDVASLSSTSVKLEETEVALDDDITEIRRIEVVDLTVSSDEDEDEEKSEEEMEDEISDLDDLSYEEPNEGPDISDQIALVTPIATVLKVDRLGIGLKAKTEGPHRRSKKRITHGQAALAAHTRNAEDVRRGKKLHGRGRRAFERANKREQLARQDTIQYLNS
jgi:hypothetical protein